MFPFGAEPNLANTSKMAAIALLHSLCTLPIVMIIYWLTESGKKRRRQPLVESNQEGQRNLQHKQVLQGLGEYSIEIHGEVLRSYYSIYSSGNGEEPIQRKNESLVRGGGDKAGVMTKGAIKRHQIPSSFCIDPDNQKLLLCPRVELNKRTTVYKCCPFGKQLKDPLFTGTTHL